MRAVTASTKVNDLRATGWGMTLRSHMKPLATLCAALLAGGLLQACAISDNPLTVFADPGKYQYNTCEQIAGQKKTWTTREKELKQLMDKAEQSTGGAVVNVLAYKADHIAALEELKVLEATARSKNCDSPDKWQSNTVVR